MSELKKFHKFEDYTKSVCRKIMSPKKKSEVREELYSHLLEEYNRNSALGIDDETSQNKAIEKMGDKEKLADSFGALYSVSPPAYMKSSLNILIWGFIFTYLNFEFISGLEKLNLLIGQLLILYSLFKIRCLNKQSKIALIIFPILSLFQSVRFFFETYFVLEETYTNLFIIASAVFYAIFYWFLFSSLEKACQQVMHENETSPHLYIGYFSILLFIANYSFNEWTNYETISVFVYISFFVALISIYNAKKILSHKEPEIELNHTLNKKEKCLYSAIVIVLIAVPLCFMYLSASRETAYEKYNSVDTSISQDKVLFAKEHMLDLGFPQEYLNDLPDSEILKYTNSTYMQISERNERDWTPEKIETFYFYFEDGGIRALNRISLPNDATAYRNAFYLDFYWDDFVYSNSSDKWSEEDYTNFNGQFFIALSEKNGEIVSSEYFDITELYNSSNGYYMQFSGYEYSFPHNTTERRAYIAQSAKVSHYGVNHIVLVDSMYYRKELPFYLTYNHFGEMAEEHFVESREWPVNDFTIDDVHYQDSFDYDASKSYFPDK